MILKYSSILVSGTLLISCGKSSGGGGGSPAATATSSATSFQDLSLSGSLSITLPASIKGSGSGSSLKLDGQKSFEACQLRRQIRESITELTASNSMLCMLENDPNVVFGKKYNIDLSSMMGGGAGGPGGGAPAGGPPAGDPPGGFPPGGPGLTDGSSMPGMPESIQVWVDNSVSGQLTVWMCQDHELNQMFRVDGVKDGKVKGSMIMKNSMALEGFTMSFHHSASFDNGYTDANVTKLTVKDLINTAVSGGDAQVARRLLALEIANEGVSKVASSFSGTMMGDESSFASIGYFDSGFGSVIAKGSVGEFQINHESFFDAANNIVNPDSYPAAFGENGTVKIAASQVPAYPTSTFSPDAFPAGAWDCSGTEDLTMSAPSGAGASGSNPMEACMEEWSELSEEDCGGAGFGHGEELQIPQGDQAPDPSSFEGFGG